MKSPARCGGLKLIEEDSVVGGRRGVLGGSLGHCGMSLASLSKTALPEQKNASGQCLGAAGGNFGALCFRCDASLGLVDVVHLLFTTPSISVVEDAEVRLGVGPAHREADLVIVFPNRLGSRVISKLTLAWNVLNCMADRPESGLPDFG